MRVEYSSFQGGFESIRNFENPDFIHGLVVDGGQYKLPKPLAVIFLRFYIDMAQGLTRRVMGVVAQANDALRAHKEWLRLEFEEELRVGISTRLKKILDGVSDVQDKREDLANVRRNIEHFEGVLLAQARDRENKMLEHSDDSLVVWDITEDLKIVDYFEVCLRQLSQRM